MSSPLPSAFHAQIQFTYIILIVLIYDPFLHSSQAAFSSFLSPLQTEFCANAKIEINDSHVI